jgi:hypothetical protein
VHINSVNSCLLCYHIGGVMVSMLLSSAVDCGGVMVSTLLSSAVDCGGVMVSMPLSVV